MILSHNFKERRLISGILFIVLIVSLVLAFFYPWPVIAVLGILGVLALLIYKQEIGLYAMIFFLPVIGWNFYYRNFEAPFIDLLGGFIFIAFALRFFYSLFFDRRNLDDFRLPFWRPFAAFFAVAAASSLMSEYALGSLWYATRWILFFYLVYFVMPVNLIRNGRVLRNAVITLVFSALAVTILGLASLPLQDWRTGFVRIKPAGIAGIFPIGENQNLLAEYLLAGIMAILALKHWYRSERFSRSANLAVFFIALVILGTFSRAGWIVLIMQAVIYFIYKSRSWSKDILAIVMTLLVLSPLAIYMVKLQSEYRIGVSSTENRVLLTQIAWNAFLEKPWFGQGSGNYIGLVADNIRFKAKYGEPLDSHGVWQKILAENGALGIAAFAFFSLSIAVFFRKALEKHADKLDLLLPLAIGGAGVYIFQFFNTSYYKGKLWVPIAIAIAAVYIIKEKKSHEQAD